MSALTQNALRLATLNGAAWLALAAYGFVSSAVVFRITGDAGYGIWATVAALRAVLTFLDGGLALGLTRDVALAHQGDARAAERASSASLAYIGLGVGVTAVAALAAALPESILGLSNDAAGQARATTILLGLEAGISLALSPATATLRGTQRFDVLALGGGAQAVVGIGLLLALTPSLGLIGAAVATLAARLAGAATYLIGMRGLLRMLRHRIGLRQLREVVQFAMPLWASAAAAAIGLSTDVPIVGAAYGAAVAGTFGIGAAAPVVAVGALWVLIDTLFPRLVAVGGASLNQLVRALTLVGCVFAGLGFGAMLLNADVILRLWVGVAPDLAADVMRIYAVTWALNIPAHVLVLGAIAHARHFRLTPIVLGEAAVNLVLSIALVLWLGPIGPALATLATLSVSNLLVVPLVLGSQVRIGFASLLSSAAIGYALGAAFSIGAWVATQGIDGDAMRLAIGVGLPALAGLGVVQLVRHTRILHRLPALLLLGGWRLLLEERREIERARDRLDDMRRALPTIWVHGQQPLVTVRIATYNRGKLVAERALESASRQTYRNLEILVVGDACDAATEAAVRSFRDPRVRFHNLPERGRYPSDPSYRWMVAGASPMNWALDHLSGDWIAPLDDDDEFTDDHVELLLEACISRKAEFAYGIAAVESLDGTWSNVGSWPLRHAHIVHGAVLYSSRLRFFKHSLQSWRIEEPGDWNLWKRMNYAGVRMTFIDRVVCRHYAESRDLAYETALGVKRLTEPAT